MDDILIHIARRLRYAELNAQPIARICEEIGEKNIEAAYQIQSMNNSIRQNNGEKIIGYKIGLTSRTVQQQLGIDQPDFGALFDSMKKENGDEISFDTLISPKVEGEIAFELNKDIRHPLKDIHELKKYIKNLRPAVEIVDSRITHWDISIADTIADNASSKYFVLGDIPYQPVDINLEECEMQLQVNGEPLSTGQGSACLGNPLNAVLWLANTLLERHEPLLAGHIILSGALGKFVDVKRGDNVKLQIDKLEEIQLKFI